jgi:hypothetical protein
MLRGKENEDGVARAATTGPAERWLFLVMAGLVPAIPARDALLT